MENLKTGTDGSYARQSRGCALMAQMSGELDVEAIKSILKDQQGQYPILRPYKPHLLLGLENAGTCCAVVMDLENGRMHVTNGSPIDHDYFVFRC
mmetsp:Transcript_32919/g.63517  ORF Transcript_32919/g.63517 Transcript_32919/m.63517 type:complete len:95 (+) Transcript_32919:35-319(+)